MNKFMNNKFFLFYAFTSIVIFMLIFTIYTQVISSYFTNALRNDLINEASSISNAYLDTLIENTSYENLNAVSYFKYKLDFLSDKMAARTVIVDTQNHIILDSEKEHPNTLKSVLNNEMIQKTMAGEIQFSIDRLPNSVDQLGVSVAVPMVRFNKNYGVVVMYSPYPTINMDMDYIYKITFLSLTAMLLLAFIFTYAYSNITKRTLDSMIKTSKEVASGNFSSRVSVPSDGEFIELANNMNDMAKELGKLEGMRKDFIANISHDFRSPLTSIKGFVQAILDGTIPHENQNKYLNIVLDESDRLSQLTNNILLLTRMENDQVMLEKVVFDIHRVLRKVIQQFEDQIVKKELSVQLQIGMKELFVFADLNQIQRVLYNLIENAIKFSHPGGQISLHSQIIKDKVEISISDAGIGIPEEHIKYIWDRFHKADRSRGMDRKGIGIGLSIVKEIIKSHEENINVISKEGRGTTFVFSLPLAGKRQ
ncbi:MAG: HAMP domain-containing histidine kinase [Vallitaleaceae bacterium]|nr:HAMP domain-containing histidine kinase [Vallitaleaceae bacterium]